MTTPKYPEVKVKLTGQNGNAFNLLEICQKAAKKTGVSSDEIIEFMAEATGGDYDHLLRTCMKWFDVT